MINRFIFNKLEQEITEPEATILLGARQVGKTTLLRQLEDRAKKAGRKTLFFDLEQPQVLAEFNIPDAEIIRKIRQAGKVVFIDEFHYMSQCIF